jgi:hypothetical protein
MTIETDANMVPGQSYTFTFQLGNWFSHPDITTILADLGQWGPTYAQSISATWMPNINPFLNLLTVTFTYSGDGSDVIADAGAEFIQAFKQGSNDDFTFNTADSGYSSTAGGVTGAPPSPDKPKNACSLDNLQGCLPSTTTTYVVVGAIVIVVLAVAFMSPGGQALAVTRSAA